MKKPTLLVVSPARDMDWWGKGKVLAPPLVLPFLAGLTPPDVNVRLVDGNVEKVDTNAHVDWVAISCMTASAPSAYTIADAFRKRGISVVMGGIHPTVLPDEAAKHADAVVVGEAELVWKDVLADLAGDRLKPRYQATKFCDLVNLPLPRRSLLKHTDRYQTINVVQTARGCPNACSFCSVSTVAGRGYRFRPITEVVEELCSLGGGWVGFIDDNITGNPNRAKELFEALIPLKLRWVGQADLNMARDPELLRLAALSGCYAMFVGIESLSQENLKATHKGPNIGLDMEEAIRKIHQAGIEIIGSFVLGLDGDDLSVFARTLDFAIRNKLVAAQFSVLTPFPGTVMRQRLEEEERITTNDWSHYTMSDVAYKPKNMTPDELKQGQLWTYRHFYSWPSILERNLTLGKRWDRLWLRLLVNMGYRGIHRGKGLPLGLPKHQDGH